MHVCVCIYIYTYVYAHMYKYVYMYKNTQMCAHIFREKIKMSYICFELWKTLSIC